MNDTQRIAELEKEVAHWKNNHANMVDRTRVLIEREDLPIERINAYRQLERMQEDYNRFQACRHQARYMQEDGGEPAFIKSIDQYRKQNSLL